MNFKMKKRRTKQILLLFLISVVLSIGLIIHGIFFDLDINQLKRLSFEGFMITFWVIFPSLLTLEYVFNMNIKNEKGGQKNVDK